MNQFVHLNLAITLLAALIVFVFGIELGNRSTVSDDAVTIFIIGQHIILYSCMHYLFVFSIATCNYFELVACKFLWSICSEGGSK